MISSPTARLRAVLQWIDLRAVAGETLLQVALVGAAWLVVRLLDGREIPSRVIGILVFAAGVAASILLAVGSVISDNRRARRVAGAVGIYTGVVLIVPAVGTAAAPAGIWALACSVATLGVVGLLVLAVRASADRRGDKVAAVGVLVVVAVATVVVAGLGLLVPGMLLPPALVGAADLVAWSGTAAAALVLLLAGTVADRALLRRAGLAFATLACANAVRIVVSGGLVGRSPWAAALEAGAVAMLLVAAVPFLSAALGSVWQQKALLAEARAELDRSPVAPRDEDPPAGPGPRPGAAGPDLPDEDLPDEDRAEAAVDSVLRDLAARHRRAGLDIEVDAPADLHVAVGGGVLARVLGHLLANCARHAPGARVLLRASRAGDRVRLEVADDGPGLPAGSTGAVLRPGTRGSGSDGAGLGLAASAELVESHQGTFTLVSDGGGCTVLVELPIAQGAPARERVVA